MAGYPAFKSLLPTKAEVNRLLAGVSEPHNSLSSVGYTHTVRLPLNVDTEQKKPYIDRSATALARTHAHTHTHTHTLTCPHRMYEFSDAD